MVSYFFENFDLLFKSPSFTEGKTPCINLPELSKMQILQTFNSVNLKLIHFQIIESLNFQINKFFLDRPLVPFSSTQQHI